MKHQVHLEPGQSHQIPLDNTTNRFTVRVSFDTPSENQYAYGFVTPSSQTPVTTPQQGAHTFEETIFDRHPQVQPYSLLIQAVGKQTLSVDLHVEPILATTRHAPPSPTSSSVSGVNGSQLIMFLLLLVFIYLVYLCIERYGRKPKLLTNTL